MIYIALFIAGYAVVRYFYRKSKGDFIKVNREMIEQKYIGFIPDYTFGEVLFYAVYEQTWKYTYKSGRTKIVKRQHKELVA